MNDLVQDFEKAKILFISAYEDLLKQGKITERQFEGVLDVLDSLDSQESAGLKKRLVTLFQPQRGEG